MTDPHHAGTPGTATESAYGTQWCAPAGDFTAVVTSGAARGRVVTLFYELGEWTLGPAFLDYYEDWLERAIRQLRTEPGRMTIV